MRIGKLKVTNDEGQIVARWNQRVLLCIKKPLKPIDPMVATDQERHVYVAKKIWNRSRFWTPYPEKPTGYGGSSWKIPLARQDLSGMWLEKIWWPISVGGINSAALDPGATVSMPHNGILVRGISILSQIRNDSPSETENA